MQSLLPEQVVSAMLRHRVALFVALFVALSLSLCCQTAAAADSDGEPGIDIERFLQTVNGDTQEQVDALIYIGEHWRPDFAPMVLEAAYLTSNAFTAQQLLALLEQNTGQGHGYDINGWYEWLWSQPPLEHPDYADFKAQLYGLIDPAFRAYFGRERKSDIRLDEVRWGGVRQDGIPPLRSPKMIAAEQADYLADEHIVFGVAINGDARAYPKRILAWHEMFVDTVGGVPLAGVYCTLCGTVIPYSSEVDGVNHALGTSGFLYRSNKLMYDRATQSLWNTLWGRPVVGPLVGEGIALERFPVVTTTWGEWRERHPQTRVLSLDTGYKRDYSEGAAYRDYFATDELMFGVPERDTRLKNKAEVLALWFAQYPDRPLAIASAYLRERPIYQDRIGELEFVVFSDASGAHRVYESRGLRFERWDGEREVSDAQGTPWALDEDKLLARDGRVLNRLPAHRAFWFGWFSAYPQTRLVY